MAIGQLQDRKIQGRERSCSKCSAPIIWLVTYMGKKVPVDAGGVIGNEQVFDREKHTPHWSVCKGNSK
jgi:hypothetical protein